MTLATYQNKIWHTTSSVVFSQAELTLSFTS